ncbi:MAG: hypothetical protein ACK5YO_38475, partial [Planctomyces sp.]
LGEAITETISTPAGNVTVDFSGTTDVTQIRSTLNLQFQNYVYASGDFLVEKTTVADLTTFTLAASNLNAFLGVNYNAAGEFGVKVTNGQLGIVVQTDTAKFAAVASGNTALEGIDGLTVTGTGSVRINRLGATINETIATPTGSVLVNFDTNTNVTQIRST